MLTPEQTSSYTITSTIDRPELTTHTSMDAISAPNLVENDLEVENHNPTRIGDSSLIQGPPTAKMQNKSNSHSKAEHTNGITEAIPSPKEAMFPFVSMTTRDAVPLLFQEPHLETGFRKLGYPWYSYVLSIFQLHNESMNVWTHMLAVVLMTSKLVKFSETVDFINDPYSWPMLAGLICGSLLYAASTGAHCMQSKSEIVHYTSFMLDYAGIGIYGLGSVIVHIEYSSIDVFYEAVKSWFIPLGSLMAFAICLCCTISKVKYTRPYPFTRKLWQIIPVASIYVLLISPIANRLFNCFIYGTDCNDSISLHMQQIFWFILSGSFFASDFPQRLKHGMCDHFFHSHQLFHVCIMICTLRQMDAVYVDFMTRQDVLLSRAAPTLFSAFGPVILTVMSELICIYIFRRHVKKKLEQAAQMKKAQ